MSTIRPSRKASPTDVSDEEWALVASTRPHSSRNATSHLRAFAAYPLAFFLFAPYTDGLFLGFMVVAFLCVRRALEMSVSITMGTDAATPYNFHGENAMELVWMAEAGLSPMQCISAATANAARALGWDDRLGTLAAGKVADLIVCAANPLEDLRHLANRGNITMVFKDGQIVARQPAPNAGNIPEEMLARGWICCGLPVGGR